MVGEETVCIIVHTRGEGKATAVVGRKRLSCSHTVATSPRVVATPGHLTVQTSLPAVGLLTVMFVHHASNVKDYESKPHLMFILAFLNTDNCVDCNLTTLLYGN